MYIVVVDDTLFATNNPAHETEEVMLLTDRADMAWVIDDVSAEVVANNFNRIGYKARVFEVLLNVEILREYDYLNNDHPS